MKPDGLISKPYYRINNEVDLSAIRELFIVSPFCKLGAMEIFLKNVPSDSDVTLVTRWSLQEFYEKVSDISCFVYLHENFPHSKVFLLDGVHAKYFRFDDEVFIGSANLTLTGLGYVGKAEEIMTRVDFDEDCKEWESFLRKSSVLATWEVYEEYSLKLERYAPQPSSVFLEPDFDWLPYASWQDLENYFTQESTRSTLEAHSHLSRDLTQLNINGEDPVSTSRFQDALSSTKIIIWIRSSMNSPLHFGEIRNYVKNEYLEIEEIDELVHRLFDWVLFFFSDEFEYGKGNHSEMLFRR